MTKRKRTAPPPPGPTKAEANPDSKSAPAAAATPARPKPAPRQAQGIPASVSILAAMAFLVPVVGSPVPELMQDTLKAGLAALLALLACFVLLWQERERREPMRWHAVLWMPALLCAYALGSLFWSHQTLATLEAARWLGVGLLVWTGLNRLTLQGVPRLAWGMHLGAVGAAGWAVLQFWLDIKLFAQGPNPGSTFVNRNLFAEFAACTIPFGLLLLANARRPLQTGLLGFSNGLVLLAVMMTGTRSALVAMWLNLLVLMPLALWRMRAQLGLASWSRRQGLLACGMLLATVVGLGLVPSGNADILAEGRGSNALERAVRRTAAIRVDDGSLAYRFLMVEQTLRVIKARPLSGVGAGAWEAEIPRYEDPAVEVENQAYAHNEYVQLAAEYGLAGGLALLLLAGYWLRCAWRSAFPATDAQAAWAPFRAAALGSLAAQFLTASVGFPWHLTATLMTLALCLAVLAAADAQLDEPGWLSAWRMPWSPAASQGLAVACIIGMGAVLFVAGQTASAERKLVSAARIGHLVLASGDPDSARWTEFRTQMVSNLREGVGAAPDYHVLIEPSAQQLIRLRDWKNAAWAWEALSASRPYSMADMANAGRAFAMSGDQAKAGVYLQRMQQLRPDSPLWMPLGVIIAAQSGQDARAVSLGQDALGRGVADFAMLGSAFEAAWRTGNFAAATAFMDKRNAAYPGTAQAGLMLLGNMFTTAARQPDKAVAYFKAALDKSPPGERPALLPRIPKEHWKALGFAESATGR